MVAGVTVISLSAPDTDQVTVVTTHSGQRNNKHRPGGAGSGAASLSTIHIKIELKSS